MAVTADFRHALPVAEGFIARLEMDEGNHLPDEWLDKNNPVFGLKRTEYGTLEDYQLTDDEKVRALCPSIFIRALSEDVPPSLLGGKFDSIIELMVVYVFYADLLDPTVSTEEQQYVRPTEAIAQRAKILSAALMKHTDGTPTTKMADVTLTTDDTSARVEEVTPGECLMEENEVDAQGIPGVYGFTIGMTVTTLTQ